jgi:hypothetical protein
MGKVQRSGLGALALAVVVAPLALLSGCGDASKSDGQVEFDAKKYEVGQNKMREYMQKKASGEVVDPSKKTPTRK